MKKYILPSNNWTQMELQARPTAEITPHKNPNKYLDVSGSWSDLWDLIWSNRSGLLEFLTIWLRFVSSICSPIKGMMMSSSLSVNSLSVLKNSQISLSLLTISLCISFSVEGHNCFLLLEQVFSRIEKYQFVSCDVMLVPDLSCRTRSGLPQLMDYECWTGNSLNVLYKILTLAKNF